MGAGTALVAITAVLTPALVTGESRARSYTNEAAALKCVYMAITSLDPTGTGRRR